MNQSDCQELPIAPRAEEIITTVAQEFKFPAAWYRKADRARQTIAASDDKGYVFSRELDKLRDHLRGFAQKLFARLTDLAKQSGIDGPCDWAEAQTWAGIGRIRSVEAYVSNWPNEIAGKYDDNLTCWVIVACSGRPIVADVPGVYDLQVPRWLARHHPVYAATTFDRNPPGWFSPEETKAIITDIDERVSEEIEKAIKIAKREQPRLTQVTEEVEVIEPDYTKVKLRGKEFIQTPLQAKIVQVLHEELKKGGSGLLKTTTINLKIKRTPVKARISQAFRTHKNWKNLIVEEGKGFYRLNVSIPKADATFPE
jgi:hypothetical protein